MGPSAKDNCSTFVYDPITMEKASTVELVIKHHSQ